MKQFMIPAIVLLVVLPGTSNVTWANARSSRIAVLHDYFDRAESEYVNRLINRLEADGYSVTGLSAQQACDQDELDADKFFLYIIPNCRTYPAVGMDALVNYAQGRGHILFLGGPLLDDPVWLGENGWLDKQQVLAQKQNALRKHRPFDLEDLETARWQRTTDDRTNPGSWKIVSDGPRGERCFRYTTERLQGWDGYMSPVNRKLYGHKHDLLVFEAKGAPGTSQVAVEIQEQDGSRWIAVASLSPQWNRIALEPQDFRYWPDSRTRGQRGRAGDRLNPAHANRVNFQLAHSHTTAVAPGKHSFWIANVGTTINPVAGMDLATATEGKSLATIFPRYKVHKIRGQLPIHPTKHNLLEGLRLPAGGNLIGGIPRTTGCGFQRAQKWRFVSLATASGPEVHRQAHPAWLLLNHTEPLAGSIFACLGWNDTQQLSTQPMLEAVSRIAQRLKLGVFLQEAGSEHFAYWPGEPIKLGAMIVNTARDAHEATLNLKVTDGHDALVLGESHAVTIPSCESSVWEASRTLPATSNSSYQITVELVAGDQVIDRVSHSVSVLDPGKPEKESFMRVEGNNFFVNEKRWYPIGINYWPLYVSGMDHKDYWAGWIQRPYYDPELVEQDLQRMKMLGINMVSIQSNDPRYYRNLLDFVHRCGRHDIYINLFCGLASPISFREKELRNFIETARLANNRNIMAYDTIWEPGNHLFRSDWRKRWDADWRQWIVEQYGDLESAEKDWQYKCPRDDSGRPIAPPDKYFREDGPWRTLMAAYRRFMDDLMSRKWNRAHSALRRLDPNHLVSFRQGNTLPHDFTFTATGKHIDFICPEGYAIPHNDDGYYVAGFITKYVHFTTGGKPVVWSEFGQSVWDPQRMEPSASRIKEVASYHDLFYRMVLETGANGTVPWWWPGGYRVGERSDYGITEPDGAARPAAMLIQKYASQLTANRDWPEATTWFEMDRDKHAGGYWHVCFNNGRDAYRQAVSNGKHLGVRTAGTGTTSVNTPMVAVGNRPINGNNPPKFLNAEFNRLQVRDVTGRWVEADDGAKIKVGRNQPILARISIGNTQEAKWIAPEAEQWQAGDVYLTTTAASQLEGRWSLPQSTTYLQDAEFGELELTPGITRTTLVELRMEAFQRTGFGEKRTFVLVVE